jgi:hypothetical protein
LFIVENISIRGSVSRVRIVRRVRGRISPININLIIISFKLIVEDESFISHVGGVGMIRRVVCSKEFDLSRDSGESNKKG